ncbi:uncharacterized protein V6R79_024382 [Siganus canaliculatus]
MMLCPHSAGARPLPVWGAGSQRASPRPAIKAQAAPDERRQLFSVKKIRPTVAPSPRCQESGRRRRSLWEAEPPGGVSGRSVALRWSRHQQDCGLSLEPLASLTRLCVLELSTGAHPPLQQAALSHRNTCFFP